VKAKGVADSDKYWAYLKGNHSKYVGGKYEKMRSYLRFDKWSPMAPDESDLWFQTKYYLYGNDDLGNNMWHYFMRKSATTTLASKSGDVLQFLLEEVLYDTNH